MIRNPRVRDAIGRTRLGRAGAALALLALSACTAVEPAADWPRLKRLAPAPYGDALRWERTAEDEAEIDAEIRGALVPGLTREEAVRIALLGNPKLQATFEDLGIARADLVQAGLLSNPSLSALIVFPLAADNSGVTLLGVLSDLWMVPARQAVAEAQAEATLHQVAAAVVATASDAANAYDDVLYQEALVEVERANRDVRLETLARQREATSAPVADALATARMEAEVLEQDLAVASAEKELAAARRHLAGVLGLDDPSLLPSLGDPLEPPSAEAWTLDDAVQFALEHRLDVAAARLRVEQAERQVVLERRERFGAVQAGGGYVGGFGTDDSAGPGLDATLPLFDQNQAGIAKAELRLRKRRKQLAALEQAVRREIADALDDIRFYARHVELYRTRLAPLQANAAEQAERLGATNDAFALLGLEARDEEIQGRRAYLGAIRSLLEARQRLRRALWAGGGDA